MKSFTAKLSILSFLVGGMAQAAHQYIQCAPNVGDSQDRVVIALWKDLTKATLFLSFDLNTDESSAVISLKKISTEATPDLLVLEGENAIATFNVVIPQSVYWKNHDDFRIAGLWTQKYTGNRYFEDLRCYARVYDSKQD